ncbi:MAG: tripartite tricarboxylate transporter TctB family protein [Burkholderiaceae bacterium]
MNSTLIVGVASIALALLFRAESSELPAAALRLPSLLIWVVVGLSVLMIAEELIKRRKARAGNPVDDDDEPLPPINWPALLMFGAAIIVYIALVPIAGYLVVTPVFLIGGMIVSKTLSPIKAVVVGGLTTAVIGGIFIWMLQLPIPLFPGQL